MVGGILQTRVDLGEKPQLIPRQNGPSVTGLSHTESFLGVAAGVSAFAFQGTNAHALLCQSPGDRRPELPSSFIWQRRRLW